jgi:periplasmic protein CpxP/Spy
MVRSSIYNSAKIDALITPTKEQNMKRKLIALSMAGALALATAVGLQAQGPEKSGHWRGHGHRGMHGFGLEHLTKDLDLTPQQQAQVTPIIDQAKPQIEAIHKEAMDKTRAVLESTKAQIRPLLTAEQQQKLDRLQEAHEKMREARREMRDAKAD